MLFASSGNFSLVSISTMTLVPFQRNKFLLIPEIPYTSTSSHWLVSSSYLHRSDMKIKDVVSAKASGDNYSLSSLFMILIPPNI